MIIVAGVAGGLQPDDVTLGTIAKSAGYNTAYMGKWHLGPMPQSQPQNQGFDQWILGFKGTTDSVLYAESVRTFNAPEALQKAAGGMILEAKQPGGEAKPVRPYDRAFRRRDRGRDRGRRVRLHQGAGHGRMIPSS